MSVLVKVTGESGLVGWGETYGIVAPQAVTAIIDEVLGPVVIGRDPADAAVIHEDLYDLDARARLLGRLLCRQPRRRRHRDLGPVRQGREPAGLAPSSAGGGTTRLPAYVSGLPKATLKERCDLAVEWVGQGLQGDQVRGGDVRRRHRAGDGGAARGGGTGHQHLRRPALEVHRRRSDPRSSAGWRSTTSTSPRRPARRRTWKARRKWRAPSAAPLALGEEWRTVFEYRPRFEARAHEHHPAGDGPYRHHRIPSDRRHGACVPRRHDPACLHRLRDLHGRQPAGDRCPAEGAVSRVPALDLRQEPGIHDRRHGLRDGFYTVPTGPGLGVEPKEAVFKYILGGSAK